MLVVENLTIFHRSQDKPLVSNVSFTLNKNESLGIIGESGSGKSLICKAILGVLPKDFTIQGTIRYNEHDLLTLSNAQWQNIRGTGMTMIMQDAINAFNPLLSMGKQFEHTFTENLGLTPQQSQEKAKEVLSLVKIKSPEDVLRQFPHQLSGGMLQRCMIALSIALKPELIFADEPTTALDAISQQRVIEQLQQLRDLVHTSLIFVSHDLTTVQQLTDKVVVLQKGICVEQGDLHQIFNHPQHAYTKYLVATNLEVSQQWKLLQQEANGND
ncbi:ABC transporter ATP-binding protein [Carnobacteriaceae bacterium zg-ZUI252]|nr:ABC transporter ATP-binding protein [Carnobacteriaceae bacterium zg-ZUI252]MBS4770343.1 ABC transporter ATP-binding protein [Carnobacteriaceae bacterium zg-ZUI240]